MPALMNAVSSDDLARYQLEASQIAPIASFLDASLSQFLSPLFELAPRYKPPLYLM